MAKTVKRTKLSPYASILFQKKTGKAQAGSVFKMSNLISAIGLENKPATRKRTRVVSEVKRNMPSRTTKAVFINTMKKARNNKVKAAENRKAAKAKANANANELATLFGKMNAKMNGSR